MWLHLYRLLVEYLIPVYNSYSALRFKRENAILSLLQYWWAVLNMISYRSVVFIVEVLFHVLSPVFDELYPHRICDYALDSLTPS